MRADVAIVGGGLVGSALAYGLSREGARVVVLDEGDDAYRASRGNFGLVWVQSKGDGMAEYAAWSRNSAGLWPGLEAALTEETGIDLGLRQPGGIEPCIGEAEYRDYAAQIARMEAQGGVGANDARMIDADEARRLVPALGPEVLGARYSPHDGHVNPLHLLRALHTANAARGVDYRPHHRVISIEPDNGSFVVQTERGPVSAGRVVLAAGLGNGALDKDVALTVPTAPERGHILVTERLAPFLDIPVGRVRQTEEGSVMFGASAEDVGFDTGLNPAIFADIADRARRVFPVLANTRIVRLWSALRIMSPDGFPIYEESVEHPGAFVVTCHSGVTLAAAHAIDLAPQLLQPGFNQSFQAFSARRFDVQAAA
ncbi:MAG: FAD-binding oxidoreductase [Rhodospirillaceae bacterium]|nr:FAD-binding oxidoreductase [Rhodospirillaceae bacterium]